MFNLNKTWLEINCPKCNYIIDIQVLSVTLEETVICNNCKQDIKLVDAEASSHKSVKNINKSIDDLNNLFKNL